MNRRLYKLSLLGLALLLLAAVSQIQKSLNRQRADPSLGLTRVTPLENAPPMLAFTTVALGSFRGLIANALWIRANDLQNDGKYFEMVQLADWITKLEPTFAQVWVVQGWNMAYNISVKFSDFADRWRWVQRGIELFRDEGLRYNPKEALIYRELAWTFQHKMGQNMDDAHMFYKRAWALEMTELFGGPRPNFDELLNPQTESARKRVQLLRQKYKMDPRQMKEVDDLYGPLEWRLPESHAIYWASVGLKESKKKDLITLRRVIYQSMQIVVLRGRLISLQTNAPIQFGPNLNQVDRANAAYEQMIQDDAEMRHAIIGAHRNFLKEAVYLLYSHNQLAKANQYFKLVREKYPDAIPANLNLDEYVLQRLTGDLATMSQDRVKAVLEGLITQYFLNLAVDEDDKAEGFDRMGRHLWEYYDQRIANRRGPLEFPPYPEMKKTVRDLLLDPERGLPPEAAARLRTKLNLPTPSNPLPSAKTGARA